MTDVCPRFKVLVLKQRVVLVSKKLDFVGLQLIVSLENPIWALV